MGAGPFSNDSQTSTRVNYQNAPIGASDQGVAISNRIAGENNRAVQQSGTGNIGLIGTGHTLTINTTDFGAIALASDLLGRALDSQANLSAQALGVAGLATDQLAYLSETKVTDGANLTQKTVFVALAVLAVMFLFLRKRS